MKLFFALVTGLVILCGCTTGGTKGWAASMTDGVLSIKPPPAPTPTPGPVPAGYYCDGKKCYKLPASAK